MLRGKLLSWNLSLSTLQERGDVRRLNTCLFYFNPLLHAAIFAMLIRKERGVPNSPLHCPITTSNLGSLMVRWKALRNLRKMMPYSVRR